MFDRVKGIISLFVIVLMVTMFTACSGGPKVQTSEAPTVSESQKETEESTTETEAQAVPEESVPEAEEPAEETSVEAESETETETTEPAPAAHSDVLVVYFSATGTTKGVAERIAAVTGGDLYEILAAEPYSDDDLNYNDRDSRSTKEQNDKNVRLENWHMNGSASV